MTQRYRQEAPTLQKLLECDMRLTGQAETLRAMLERKDGAWMIGKSSEILDGLKRDRGNVAQSEGGAVRVRVEGCAAPHPSCSA